MSAPGPLSGALVEASGIVVRRGGRPILDHVDLAVEAGRIVTVIGPNGSGKTTLVRVMLGLAKPEEGTVVRRAEMRVGYVPQRLEIDPTLPLDVRRFLLLGSPAAGARLERALAEVGAPQVLKSPIQEISGGELRRVLLARALIREPELLVLDELTSGVDLMGRAELYALVAAIRDARGCGVLLVSHNLHLVMAASDDVVCLNHHVCCRGRPDSVQRDPEYLALFGPAAAETLAVYTHDHDHQHDPSGAPVALGGPEHRRHAG